MIQYKCDGCGAELESPSSLAGGEDQCPVCGHVCKVPHTSTHSTKEACKTGAVAVGKTIGQTYRGWLAFRDTFLRVDAPDPGKRTVRRCPRCGRTRFAAPSKCDQCEDLTFGTDIFTWYSGVDTLLQHALPRFKAAESKRQKLVWLLIAIIGVTFVLFLLVKGFWSGIGSAIVASVICFLVYCTWTFVSVRGSRRIWRSVLIAKEKQAALQQDSLPLEKICRERVFPFLERNGVRHFVWSPIASDEIEMLREYLRSRGAEIGLDVFDVFLRACALKRDSEYFRDRIRASIQNGADAVREYSRLYLPEHDWTLLPFLEEYVHVHGQYRTTDVLAQQLEEYRHQDKLHGFEKDLQMRSTGQSQSVTIGAVDAMEPFKFEQLLGMIFETKGFRVEETPKTGDQGADVLLERAGERTVVQAKLYAHPVGNSAVQEAVAAKAHFRCQHAIVATNNGFTRSAEELALSNGVQLIGRSGLMELLADFNRSPKDYGRLAKLLVPNTYLSAEGAAGGLRTSDGQEKPLAPDEPAG